jgi:acyl-coenzyme A synthetase/AMP-(fatty) acid ligase
MMEVPLTIRWIFDHVRRNHARREVVSREEDGSIFRYTYGDFGARVARLANALVEMGVRPGDRVASFGWNTHRHLELYYAVPMIGAVRTRTAGPSLADAADADRRWVRGPALALRRSAASRHHDLPCVGDDRDVADRLRRGDDLRTPQGVAGTLA